MCPWENATKPKTLRSEHKTTWFHQFSGPFLSISFVCKKKQLRSQTRKQIWWKRGKGGIWKTLRDGGGGLKTKHFECISFDLHIQIETNTVESSPMLPPNHLCSLVFPKSTSLASRNCLLGEIKPRVTKPKTTARVAKPQAAFHPCRKFPLNG